MEKIKAKTIEEENLLNGMAEVKAEIEDLGFWVDNARTDKIAKIRYDKVKGRLKELVIEHKNLTKKLSSYYLKKGGE